MEPRIPTLLASYFDKTLTIELLADHRFQTLGLRLSSGQQIRFQGSLSSPSVGGLKPEVVLNSLECLSCLPDSSFDNHAESTSSQQPAGVLPDVTIFATNALQGAADFILPHFLRLNVTQLLRSG